MLRRRFSAVKPRLTPTHKKRRLEFALRHVRQPRGLRQPRFVDLYDVLDQGAALLRQYIVRYPSYLARM
ncbi:hypothetical protein PF010_g28652 [Phytophthora fragariae]|uniref:Transposase Tc1-like domain-containing protein n=1 Tax=Phytophthora fragariae TaxID=53985 RepID=A0A6A4BC41_9STRA|nr:hypothetical protein PF010_g28652 [Phytophthora fragariae]KAE9270692.1 hypothetical protein PF001_g28694 [Phytophthora fragariae]